jgi:antitoxin (DNA-binding transcriptional repressor) of toxin-antitoxin stability system
VIQEGDTPLVRLAPVIPIRRERVFGVYEGKVVVPDDFNEPLPEFEDLFYNCAEEVVASRPTRSLR